MSKKLVYVTVTITLKTSFESYNEKYLDDEALSQIKIWCKETLEEEGEIPLYIGGRVEDLTTEPKIIVNVLKDE